MNMPLEIPMSKFYALGLRTTWVHALMAAGLAGCATAPSPTRPAQPPPPLVQSAPAPIQSVSSLPSVLPLIPEKVSHANSAREYRRDAAAHLYTQNGGRIYKGKMPPLLYAVAVIDVDIDPAGQVRAVRWLRAPSHAPEVTAEIERSVRQAAPYPVPVRLKGVTYTDTWLWHQSGNFQLDTLTEGQL